MKRLALQLMQTCGVFALVRTVTAKTGRIVMYHNICANDGKANDDVTIAAARTQLAYLHRHFMVVPLGHLVTRLKAGLDLPSNAVVLTVDDGRRNCYEFLFPLLQEFRVTATFFVVSSFIRGEDWIWTDKVLWLSGHPRRPPELAVDNIDGFFRTLNRLTPRMRNARIEDIARQIGISIPNAPPPRYAPCSWSELREMADSGLVEIGSHTRTHPIFSSITDNESWRELTTSRVEIEEELGRSVQAFCFPNGKPEDYRSTQVQQVAEAGYNSAVVASAGLVHKEADPYQLPRIGVSARQDALALAKCLDGVDHYQAKLENSLRLRRNHAPDLAKPDMSPSSS